VFNKLHACDFVFLDKTKEPDWNDSFTVWFSQTKTYNHWKLSNFAATGRCDDVCF